MTAAAPSLDDVIAEIRNEARDLTAAGEDASTLRDWANRIAKHTRAALQADPVADGPDEEDGPWAPGWFDRYQPNAPEPFTAPPTDALPADRAAAWQPMKTAPKDGTVYWVSDGTYVRETQGHCWPHYEVRPTHWMPVVPPAPPTDEAPAKGEADALDIYAFKEIVAKYVGRTSRIYLYIANDLALAMHRIGNPKEPT